MGTSRLEYKYESDTNIARCERIVGDDPGPAGAPMDRPGERGGDVLCRTVAAHHEHVPFGRERACLRVTRSGDRRSPLAGVSLRGGEPQGRTRADGGLLVPVGIVTNTVAGLWSFAIDTLDPTVFETPAAILTDLAISGLYGVVVGWYNIRARWIPEEATRAKAQREHAERQRETLTCSIERCATTCSNAQRYRRSRCPPRRAYRRRR